MRTQTRRLPRRAGFTLIETLIVITLIAILATVVLPAARSTEMKSLESAARILAADLRLARSLAVQYNTQWSIEFDVDENAYELVHTGPGNAPLPPNPLAGSAERSETYRVDLNRWGAAIRRSSDIRLGPATTLDSKQAVDSVAFGPQGGTGPSRNVDTVIWLLQGSDPDVRAVRLTVSWVTGQVWVGPPETFTLQNLHKSDP